MTTTSKTVDLRQVLNSGNPNQIADIAKKVKLGNMLSAIKIVVASLSATATPDVTSDDVKAAATISGITLDDNENLPPIGSILALRVTASGTAGSLGVYVCGDASATAIVPPGGAGAAVGVAKVSNDGTTLTFPNTVTGFVLEYMPRPDVAMNTSWPIGGI